MKRELVSKPGDGRGMRRRVEVALRKAGRGEELTKKELMIVQWVTSPGGCPACTTRVKVLRDERRDHRPEREGR